MEPSYELFDHTADIGIRVRAATLPALLQPAAAALYAVIGDLVAGDESEPATFNLTGEEPACLLRDYLAELLVLFERNSRFVTSLDVSTFDENRLAAVAHTRFVDHEHSGGYREVKAITYHELRIRSIPGGYEATIIVDI